MGQEHFIPPEARADSMPFKDVPQEEAKKPDINTVIHSLRHEQPESGALMDEETSHEYQTPDYLISEYSNEGRDLAWLKEQKRYYEKLKEVLGDFVPDTHFVVGEPSNPQTAAESKSFYVVQDVGGSPTLKNGKNLSQLNENEYSVGVMEKLLEVQGRLEAFLKQEEEIIKKAGLNTEQLTSFDPKKFDKNIFYDPATGDMKITGLFNVDQALTKSVMENKSEFEPSEKPALPIMKELQNKAQWFLEKSQATQWIFGQRMNWQLDRKETIDGKKAMALTFDDGPNDQTEKILDILKAKNIKATFFVVGSLIKGRESTLKRIADEGHEIGMHEWDHKIMHNTGAKERFVGDFPLGGMKKTMDEIERVTGKRPTMGRVAGSHGTLASLREAESQDLKMIHADFSDVAHLMPNPKMSAKTMLEVAKNTMYPGKINLLHIGDMKPWGEVTKDSLNPDKINDDTSLDEKAKEYLRSCATNNFPPDETVKMLGDYIDYSQQQGYEFVDLDKYTNKDKAASLPAGQMVKNIVKGFLIKKKRI